MGQSCDKLLKFGSRFWSSSSFGYPLSALVAEEHDLPGYGEVDKYRGEGVIVIIALKVVITSLIPNMIVPADCQLSIGFLP